MSLPSGVRLGPYEVLAPLGAGGMGEVYEARDTRLDRSVAVKVLPERLAADPQLKARFEREARAVSKLSHPHICALFDVGEAEIPAATEGGRFSSQLKRPASVPADPQLKRPASVPADPELKRPASVPADGGTGGEQPAPRGGRTVPYLVMERLEGETLEARLRRGPLPPEAVLELGRQIAAALAAAHREGIVHRDLKPGNVMVTREGVKLLDFGLARTIREAEAPGSTELEALATAPKEDTPLTQEGTILGTFFYMSPEQLEGREADERADIFALGAVLYEMATGRRAFDGESRASVIAAVMGKEPEPISRLQPVAPPALDHVVSRCLAKDPEERWQSARDVAAELLWIAQQGSQAGVPAPVARRRRSREAVAWGAAAVLGLAAIALAAFHLAAPAPDPPLAVRFAIEAPEGTGFEGAPVVSPDGRRIVFAAIDEGGTKRLWLRSLESREARPISGTQEPDGPFWSPDGRSLAFFAGGELKRTDLDGSVRTLCAAPGRVTGTWGSRGDILFGFERILLRVSEGGGVPTPVPILPESEADIVQGFWPRFLPDGEHFLLGIWHGDSGGIYLASLSSPERRLLVAARDHADLSWTGVDDSGRLLFARDGALFAQRFDLRRLELEGEPVRLADRVHMTGPGASLFSVSGNGVLAYREAETERTTRLTWLDRSGAAVGTIGPPGRWRAARPSPDGSRVVGVRVLPGEQPSLWLLDVARGTTQRFTRFEWAGAPVWSPEGERIAFAAAIGTPPNPFLLDLARPEEPRRLGRYPHQAYPQGWSADGGDLLLVTVEGGATAGDLWRLPVDGGELELLTRGRRDVGPGRLSPDGRWLAYSSIESGRWEIYLTSFPEPGRSRLVSTAGGGDPRWSPDSRTLYYVAPEPEPTLMAVPVRTEPELSLGLPEPLFALRAAPDYDVTPDGERFLAPLPTGEQESPPIHVVVNWPAELGR